MRQITDVGSTFRGKLKNEFARRAVHSLYGIFPTDKHISATDRATFIRDAVAQWLIQGAWMHGKTEV